jgi:hypothetical protein
MRIRYSAASSEDLEFRGMWLRMWSSINSAIRALTAPRVSSPSLKYVGALFVPE